MTKTKKRAFSEKIFHKTKKTKKNRTISETGITVYKPFISDFAQSVPKNLLEKSHRQLMKMLVKNLNVRYAPAKITAQNDFYTYINYKWLTDSEIDSVKLSESQKYITQIDDFRIVQDKVYLELRDILTDYVKHNHDSKAKTIKNFMSAAETLDSPSASKVKIHQYITQLDELRKDKTNIWKLLGILNKHEMIKNQLPFSWSVMADDKNASKNKSHINPINLPIIDLDAYYVPGNKSKAKFLHYCKVLFKTTLGSEYVKYYKDPFNIQVKLFYLLGCKGDKGAEDGYNVVSAKEAKEKYNFDWEELTKYIGYKTTPPNFICGELNYLKCCSDTLLKEWDSEEWRGYWIWLYIRQIVKTTKNWELIHFNFYGKFEQGEEENIDVNHKTVIYSTLAFNDLLTKEYLLKHVDPEKVKYVNGLAKDLKDVFLRIVSRNTWLTQKTKAYALKKLNKLTFNVAEPFYYENDPVIDYTPDSFWDNVNMLFEWRTKKFISMENGPLTDLPMLDFNKTPPKIVGFQTYVVNAAFIPSRNKIFINGGYVQEPFVDLRGRGIENLLAYVGFTLGHEMSHCLDNWGSKFDEIGNLHNWWMPSDERHFNKIQKDITTQYELWAKRDGIIFDAAIGVGEDMADISGLAICDEYLRDYQIQNKDIMPIRAISYDTFYIYFAFQQRQKVSRRALSAQLKSNPHPLDKYRTNVPLSRSLIFKANYNVEKGDGMYWPSDSTIW
jgi:predicted metalloendopeptidase